MDKIIPYNEELLKTGGFITKNSEFKLIPLYGIHETLSRSICYGNCLNSSRFIHGLRKDEITYEEYDGELSKEEFNKFKLFSKYYFDNHYDAHKIATEFLTLVARYDKVETSITGFITTSSIEPHVKLYNYYLMEAQIYILKYIYKYNKELNSFETKQLIEVTDEDIEYEKELDEIREKVLLKDRHLFLK